MTSPGDSINNPIVLDDPSQMSSTLAELGPTLLNTSSRESSTFSDPPSRLPTPEALRESNDPQDDEKSTIVVELPDSANSESSEDSVYESCHSEFEEDSKQEEEEPKRTQKRPQAPTNRLYQTSRPESPRRKAESARMIERERRRKEAMQAKILERKSRAREAKRAKLLLDRKLRAREAEQANIRDQQRRAIEAQQAEIRQRAQQTRIAEDDGTPFQRHRNWVLKSRLLDRPTTRLHPARPGPIASNDPTRFQQPDIMLQDSHARSFVHQVWISPSNMPFPAPPEGCRTQEDLVEYIADCQKERNLWLKRVKIDKPTRRADEIIYAEYGWRPDEKRWNWSIVYVDEDDEEEQEEADVEDDGPPKKKKKQRRDELLEVDGLKTWF
ncbi:uncharacterized protein LY89DRAFT_756900 [Mollisia scopiformis]|uniref:Uncharacterized protein n=1 Tax=Mollisia scopiformis TaxID=149040 RepID=A0A194WWT1_MOLSC|nr:uncharacterized protein LY89DRAFT_756900 [Mollisia scopiformis]KUJ12436.1 hypothetical protein LY89DRAFT_756900 [Mollisia scopiformis]